MNSTVFRFELDFDKQDSQVCMTARVGDTARSLSALLRESGTPYEIGDDTTVVIAAADSDGSYIYGDCTVTDNRIEFTLDSTFTASEDTLTCCFILTEDSAALFSPPFTILVDAPAAPQES